MVQKTQNSCDLNSELTDSHKTYKWKIINFIYNYKNF